MYQDFVDSMMSAFNKSISDHVYNHFVNGGNEAMLNEQADKAFKLATEKIDARIRDELETALYGGNHKTYTSAVSVFTMKEFERTMKILNDMPPIAIRMEVFKEGFMVMSQTIIRSNVDDGMDINPLKGIKVIVVEDDPELRVNQGRIIYNNGTSKIIDIYTIVHR